MFLIEDTQNLNDCKNIVQPDISVICDKNKLNERGCIGSPDMIVEIVSPFNPSNDYVRKLGLYEKYGVSEYWIINPMEQNILIYILGENLQYTSPKSYIFKDTIKVSIFDNLQINLTNLGF